MYQVWIVSLPLRGVKEIDYKFEAHGSTFEIRGREMMPEIDCNPALLAASMIKSQSPHKLQSTLATVFPPDIVGVLNKISIHVYAPHALAPAKRSGLPHSSVGAIELPSPHQFTIWPSFIEVRARGSADPTSVLQELEAVCANLWSISIRTMPGYRRVLSNGDSDIRGQVPDFGTNQPNEYQKIVPGDIAFPGSQRIDNNMISWSCVLPTTVPCHSSEEAAAFAESFEQAMTSLGNLWAFTRYSTPGHFGELIRVEMICRNFGSLIEKVCYLIRGEKVCDKETKGDSPVKSQFAGSEAKFVKLITISFEQISQLKGFLNQHRAEIELLAANWHKIRNREVHAPSPVLRSSFDLGSMSSIVGTVTADNVARIALRLGVEVIDRVDFFPTNALV